MTDTPRVPQPVTADPQQVPPGAPVFVSGGDHGHIGTYMGSVEEAYQEVEMWKGLLWDILAADPEPGLPRTTLHVDVKDERPCLVTYYTRVELSETQAEMLRDLIDEKN